MTNEELQEAITMTNAMLKAAGTDCPRHAMYVRHLGELLSIQANRARGSDQWPFPVGGGLTECDMHDDESV